MEGRKVALGSTRFVELSALVDTLGIDKRSHSKQPA